MLAERVYAPWTDLEAELRAAGVPLYGLETRHALSDFDVIGFSLPYEQLYTNVLNMLDLAGLPLRAVVCLRAYKKLEGLHDLSVLVATLDGSEIGVQGRFDARGVSLASAQRLTAHYLDGFAWSTPKNDSR